ncbi:hypothetical protein K0M31_012598 [Melipona bicolor]|uniref:Uncharacterized protein n=1 Tax=Melipona bicolor TaxID=60889 RepID=A0AA40KHG3_9HYME|nr:hypothetical protein K0M31_012598 [Melipona bicolor]
MNPSSLERFICRKRPDQNFNSIEDIPTCKKKIKTISIVSVLEQNRTLRLGSWNALQRSSRCHGTLLSMGPLSYPERQS